MKKEKTKKALVFKEVLSNPLIFTGIPVLSGIIAKNFGINEALVISGVGIIIWIVLIELRIKDLENEVHEK